MKTKDFQELIWQKGKELYREMPWREDTGPYYILTSELMLQQTQVDRVISKFTAFIDRFPDVASLAAAPLSDVLSLWNGLGYNRRAKFLQAAAKMIVDEFDGNFPENFDELRKLPGVGPGTAGAIMVYAFNAPTPFIETNVRTVYFYHFFADRDQIADKEIQSHLEATIDKEHPREFYWALMDYGTWLKKSGVGGIKRSKHYKKQSALKGSVREVRGQIIRELTKGESSLTQLRTVLAADERFTPALEGLKKDGLVTMNEEVLHLTK